MNVGRFTIAKDGQFYVVVFDLEKNVKPYRHVIFTSRAKLTETQVNNVYMSQFIGLVKALYPDYVDEKTLYAVKFKSDVNNENIIQLWKDLSKDFVILNE
jgi:hypothetical protein